MKAKINNRLLATLKAGPKPYQIHDTDLRGFIIRVQPSGAMTFIAFARMKNGKRVRFTIGPHSRFTAQQARDKAKELLADIAKGTDPTQRAKGESYTLRRFIAEKYEKWAVVNLESGAATSKRVTSVFSDLADIPMSKINDWIIDKWRTERLRSGTSRATVNRDVTALKGVLTLAISQKVLPDSSLIKLKAKKVDSKAIVRFLSDDEENRLREALEKREQRIRCDRKNGNRWRAERGRELLPDLHLVSFADHLQPLVIISLNTGLRRGELLKLRWEAVNFAQASLAVIGPTAKSGETRHVPLNKEALQTLIQWREQSRDIGAAKWVFPGDGTNPLKDIKKSWKAVLLSAAISNFRWHDIRHHFASRLVMSGVDLNTVRELLGHADIKMTLRYAHLAPHLKVDAVAKLVRN